MRWWILAVLGVAQLMVILDTTIVNIALPTAQHALHFSNADRQWIVTAYSLAFGSLLLLGGRIGDIIGRKRALLIGLIGFAVASAIGGASTSFIMLVGARTVQGAFGALLAPSVLALLTTTFSDPANGARRSASTGPSPAPVAASGSCSVASSPRTRRGGTASSST
jgi:MFS family permease